MKNWLVAAFALLLIAGCSKYTTPRKVERHLTNGTWKISTFSVDGNTLTNVYTAYTFAFGEKGNVKVKGGFNAKGSWELGLDRNPAVLYLSFPPAGNLEYIADDWEVKKIKKDKMELKRVDNTHNSTLVFIKIE